MKKIDKFMIVNVLMGVFLIFSGCRKEEVDYLKIRPERVEFMTSGGTMPISIETNADSWSIDNPAVDWIELSESNGLGGTANVTLTVASRTLTERKDTLIVTAGSASPVKVIVSQPSSAYLYDITTSKNEMEYESEGGSISLNITTEAASWSLSVDASWLIISETIGTSGTTTIDISAPVYSETSPRNATITITGEDAQTVTIPITQLGELYPNYNTSPLPKDAIGMSSTAVEIANDIVAGINIGNTLEAIGGETNWGNPVITNDFIQLIKNNGFNAVRLPCSWDQYSNQATAEIDATWLNRVKEVVQYCVDNDMYVILNIHWDGGWLENNCVESKRIENKAKQKAFWQQIATHLRDFDEHLMFAGANEPNVEDAAQMEVLMSYHQTFINAVRSTGGKNSYRILVVQGPSTDIEKTNNLMTSMPTDEVADRMMAEIHYYTPYQFCLMTKDENWGNMFYYWGSGYHSTTDTGRNATWGEESELDAFFESMKTKFVDNGIPVILGEYGVIRRTSLTGDNLDLHLASRLYYIEYATRKAKANGMLPFYWDTGDLGNHGSGIFDRDNLTVFDQDALDALMEGANN